MAAAAAAGFPGGAVSLQEAATALRPLALTTLEKQHDPTYAVPQHYLYELAVHTRYCPLDTKFAIEPSQPGTGYGTAICLENNCFLEIKLEASRWTASADGGLSTGIGGLAPYTAHVQNASEAHRAARDARVKAQQAENARNGVQARPPTSLPGPAASTPSALPPAIQAYAHPMAHSSGTPVSTPIINRGAGSSYSGVIAPLDIKPFHAINGQQLPAAASSSSSAVKPDHANPGPYASSDIKSKPGMIPSFSSSSSSPGPSTPALMNGVPLSNHAKHPLAHALPSSAIKRLSSSNPPSSASSGSSSSSKRRKGVNGSALPLSSSTNDPARDAEIGRLGYAAPKQHPSQRRKRKSSEGGDGDSDAGSSASEGERLARERRAKRYENRMDGMLSARGHDTDEGDENEDEDCANYSSESDGYGGRRSVFHNLLNGGGARRRRLRRAGEGRGTPGASGSGETIEEFTRRSLAGTGFENNLDIGKAREALGLQRPGDFIPGTNIDPYPYQCIGINWLLTKEKALKGGLLADEMGLGKTCQMISLMALAPSKDRKRKTTLVVAPVALLTQWKEEIEEKTDEGTYDILIYHGNAKKGMKPKEIMNHDIVITTYGIISSEWYDENKDSARKDYGPLFDCRFYRIILDEAQLIRNPSSRYSKSVAELAARYKWCLTGTPLVNSLNDAFPYLRFIGMPKYGERDEFYPHITKIEKRDPALASKRLAALLRGVMIRRTKKCEFDGKPIITLPTKHKEDIDIILSQEERDIYNSIEKGMQVKFTKFMKAGTVTKNYTNILTMLLWLRMCCDHPALACTNAVPWEDAGEAAKRAAAECDRARIINGLDWVEKVKKMQLDKAINAIKAEKEGKEADGDECPVCREPVGDGKITKCLHIFCQDCLTNLLTSAPTGDMLEEDDVSVRPCPCCRAPVSGSNVFALAAFEPSEETLDLHRGIKKSPKKKKKEEPSPGSKSFAAIVDISDSDEELPSLPMIKKETKPTVKEEKKPVVKAEVKKEDDDDEIQIIPSPSAAVRTPAKKVTKMSNKKKGKRPAKPRRKRLDTDSSDGMSDFIVEDDEDPYADRPSRKKNKGKRRASNSRSPAGSEADDTESDSDSSDDGKPLSKISLSSTMAKFVPSSKLSKAMKHVKDLFADPQTKRDKIIIISQWTTALDLMGNFLRSEGIRFVEFDGRLDMEGKDAAAREFKKNKKTKIMLLSLKAGGVGLNLTVANHVINLDLAYNTAVEDQAFDRCHRIGQKKEVHVHRYIVKDSVEERILALQERKDALIDGAIGDKSIARSGRFTADDFANLFGLAPRQPADRAHPAVPLVQARLARMPARNPAVAAGEAGAAEANGNNAVANVANAVLAGLGAFNGIENL